MPDVDFKVAFRPQYRAKPIGGPEQRFVSLGDAIDHLLYGATGGLLTAPDGEFFSLLPPRVVPCR